jgi:uncharacterized protein YciI
LISQTIQSAHPDEGGSVETSPSTSSIELDRFELVLLRWPENRAIVSDEEADRIQNLHLAHLDALAKSGDILAAGPFDEQPDVTLRGMCIYRTGSLERTRSLATADPAVVAGRLEVDVMYFYCPKGQL